LWEKSYRVTEDQRGTFKKHNIMALRKENLKGREAKPRV